ncbi:MAG: LytTR family transcriptional regulator DNA-binding domain-containing protein [Erythrobacter sp.]|nr:LytTR family transcriptional regulator DNA-binding domain-containing protein [Erythrobacter sp.]
MDTPSANPRHALARRIIIDLAVMTGIGVFLALSGAFGSMALPLPVRLVSWVGFAWLGYGFFRPMETVVGWAERTLDLPRWGLWVAGCLIASAPMTLAVLAIGSLPGPLVWPSGAMMMGTYPSVLVIGGAVTLLFNLVKPGQREAQAVAAPMPTASPPATSIPHVPAPVAAPMPVAEVTPPPPLPNPLFDQLPPELGSDIIALEMEDHYVRVHTALGSALVLMRLRDAMVLIADVEGMQVHRSWWVARAAVEDVLRDGRNIRLKLARDVEAPVARANVATLRDARWI